MDPFLGEIRTFPWSFAPKGWALCNGALLPVNQNQALFSLLGVMYGGNGQSTFGLPNLQGRTPIHAGANGGQNYPQGQLAGAETVPLTVANLPGHSHAMNAQGGSPGNIPGPSGNLPATAAPATSGGNTVYIYTSNLGSTVQLAADSVTNSGNGVPHNNMQPFLVLNFCIALQGIFPSRS